MWNVLMYFNTERESVLTADCNRLTIIWRLLKRGLELTDNSNQCWKNLPRWKPVRFCTKVRCFVQYTLWRSYIDTKTVFYWNIKIFYRTGKFFTEKKRQIWSIMGTNSIENIKNLYQPITIKNISNNIHGPLTWGEKISKTENSL